MTGMTRVWTGLTIGFLALTGWAAEVDGVAAKVGTESILRSDVMMELYRRRASESAYQDVLNELIERKLILRAAQDAKMTMQAWVVESRIREIIEKSFDGDRNQLMETLSKQKVSYTEWHARMKEDMIIAAMRWNVVDKNVTASPSDMQREYEENADRYAIDSKVSVSVILLKPEAADQKDAVRAELATNDFATVARSYSAGSHASQGGLWSDISPRDVFTPEICETISTLAIGQTSDWVNLNGWNFLIRKEAETSGRQRSFEEAYDQIAANVKEAQAKEAYRAWIGRLRGEIFIKVY